MTDDKDIIARRIAGICNAKPAVCPPSQPRRQGSSSDRAEREPVFRLASVYTGKNAFVRCVVKNVSDDGVRIALQTSQTLPEIIIIKFDQNGARKRARVVWQQGDEAGVKFGNDQTGVDAVCPAIAPTRAVR